MNTDNNNKKKTKNHVNTAYSTFAVLFYINRQKVKKNGLCPLMGRISINAEIAQFSAGIDLDPALWDAKNYRMKGRSRHAAEVNHFIQQLTEKINRYYKEILDEQGYITAELVKNAITGIGRKEENLLELFRKHNDTYGKQAGISRSENYIVIYKTVYKHVERFISAHYGVDDIPLRKLELSFIEKFDSYLRIELRFAAYTISAYMIILRKMIRLAISKGILRKNPFTAYIPEQPPRKRRHMTQDELDKFMQTPIASKALCHTRDMFVFSTFTGLAYADLCNLSEEHLHKERNGSLWIRIKRQKTGTECNIQLLDIPKAIIEKYKPERIGNRIFNTRSITRVEVNLKKIAKLCGIEKQISYHMSRYNFATLITLSQGVPLETVSQMMGHKCFRTTQIYAKLTRQKVNEDMKQLSDRIGRKFRLPDDKKGNNNRKTMQNNENQTE
ncbi:Tyrosine recombinase XerC [termite gut metagenome]|uniref:Tyrosine recombinase XerC n=1 Tax=termite gut metagenome TaxID=433724 RepID=A0A5J4RPU4_9ZZZZ